MLNTTWHYCPTADNPADMITRGTTVQQLATSSLWNKGPPWLTSDKNWPQWSPSKSFHLDVAAVISEEFVPLPPTPLPKHQTIINLHKIIDSNNYSNLGRLLRITAYVHRFTCNIMKSNSCQYDHLTATEIDFARKQWIRNSQYQVYSAELANLNSKSSSNQRIMLVCQL